MKSWSHEQVTEVRQRAVRMVREHQGECPSLWAASEPIAPKIGCVPQALHEWVKCEEVDTRQREGLSISERENTELRHANDILKAASAFFTQAGLDRRLKS